MKWWRKLPGWHQREVAFRDWYVGLLDRVNLEQRRSYEQAVRVLKCPEEVTRLPRSPLPEDGRRPRAGRGRAGAAPPKVEMEVKRDVLDVFRTPAGV